MKRLISLFQNKPILFFFLAIFIFFYPFFLQGKIPIPADTIVGMYHPWRDVTWDNYTTGVPFKNFLITDPVRQQYVWKNLAVDEVKKGNLPLWNPYSFSGSPLFSNFQAAPFYPLNILFFVLPFNLAWAILVILQPFLAGIFLYMYLRYLKIDKLASVLGSLTFSFSGFSIAWLEWNTILHTVLWLPLILLSIEKIISSRQITWLLVFIFSLVSSFFAGHLQVFFYSLILIIAYTILRILFISKDKFKTILLFVVCFLLFVVITSIQWLPTMQFISQSARSIDQGSWTNEGWFIPWQNLIQFLAPDFFGNPATANYWGVWNYGEFIGYVGILPLIFAIFALIFRRDKKSTFFTCVILFALIFALPTSIAKLPYQLQIPFLSTSQPTRLLFLVDFSLAVLTALGFDYFLKNKNLMIKIIKILGLIGVIYGITWLFVLFVKNFSTSIMEENFLVTKRNLILPSTLLLVSSFLLLFFTKVKKQLHFASMIYIIVAVVVFDLFRFGWKFTPFVKQEWIFPPTKLIEFLNSGKENFRILPLDRRIMPSNFSVYYRLQDVSGYDPLYLANYARLVSAWERNKPDISLASFNRIIIPINFENFITDLLGVKYLLSLSPIKSEKLEFVASEGTTYLYKNKEAFPRAFFVEEIVEAKDEQEEIEKMYMLGNRLREVAVTTEALGLAAQKLSNNESVRFSDYQPNYIKIVAKTSFQRLMVLTDIYYPAWKVFVDGKEARLTKVDFALRGVVVPTGEHVIEFKINLI